MSNEVKQFVRSMCVKGGCKQTAKRNKLFEMGYAYGTDAWCGHDCVIVDRRTGDPVVWRDGREVTFA